MCRDIWGDFRVTASWPSSLQLSGRLFTNTFSLFNTYNIFFKHWCYYFTQFILVASDKRKVTEVELLIQMFIVQSIHHVQSC